MLLLGVGLRFHALVQDTRFHPDEALYATFARSAAVDGDWLLHGTLDKPPLSIYAISFAMMLMGVTSDANGVLQLDVHQGEFAARIPSTLANILLMAVMYALAQRVYGQYTGRTRYSSFLLALVAMLLTALSPFGIAFSATAFTDGLMLLFMTLGLWAGVRQQWVWSGVWLALSFASKPQGLFYAPLVVALAVAANPTLPLRTHLRNLIRLAVPIVMGTALLLIWDAARAEQTSFFVLGALHVSPDHLVPLGDELVPRLLTWLDYGQSLLGYAWLTAALLILALAVLAVRLFRNRETPTTRIDAVLLMFCVGFGLLHWLTAFNAIDRYLLPLLPPLILLTARGIAGLSVMYGGGNLLQAQGCRGYKPDLLAFMRLCAFALTFLILFFAGKDASEGRINVGGDHGTYRGIDALADYLNSQPVAAVVYDRWLGWELHYYLGVWTNKRLTYYPTPEALIPDALKLPEIGARYFPAPTDAPVMPWIEALQGVGFQVSIAYTTPQFEVYRLIPPQPRPSG